MVTTRILQFIVVAAALAGVALSHASASDTITAGSPLYKLTIEAQHNVVQGVFVDIPVTLDRLGGGSGPIAFDLKLRVDPLYLRVQELRRTDSPDLMWDHFEYSFNGEQGCRSDCPTAIITVQARARFREVAVSTTRSGSHELFVLRVLVTNDRTAMCKNAHVKWYWENCRDNVVRVTGPFRRLLSRNVEDPMTWCANDDTFDNYPSTLGVGDDCPPGAELQTLRAIDFVHGGAEILCYNTADPRGDLNQDGLAFTDADYDLYKSYFFDGSEVFDNHYPASAWASEINGDSRQLTVSDMIYMGHIIIGNDLRCPPNRVPNCELLFWGDESVSLLSADTVGGLYLKLAGRHAPELLQPDATMFFDIETDTTRILILGKDRFAPARLLSGPLLRLSGANSTVSSQSIVEAQASTVTGYYMAAFPTQATAPKDTCPIADSEQPLYRLQIGKYRNAIQGTWLDIPVTFTPGPLSGDLIDIDLRLQVDPSAFILKNIFRGETDNLSWEQFAVDYTTAGHCVADCPPSQAHITGRIRLKAPVLPSGAICGPIRLLTLYGITSNDRILECHFLPIRWLWESCRDNVLRISQSNCRLISRRVADYWTELWLQDSTVGYPTLLGAQRNCPPRADLRLVRGVDFVHGGIEVVCTDIIELRGDINLNGVAYEIYDYVLYENYFLTGPSAFPDMNEARIEASEINGDGHPLTVADLVYLNRIIDGDALPLPRHDLRIVPLTLLDGEYLIVNFPDTVAALYLKIAGSHVPELLFDSATMKARVAFDTTRILIYGPMTSTMLLRFPPRGSRLLMSDFIEIQGSSPEGYHLEGRLDVATGVDQSEPGATPRSYRLDQNYPNPFNASTRIRFALPRATFVDLRIYNIEGQLVRQLSVGIMPAGEHSITWLGTDQEGNAVPSGVYFYRLTAGEFSESRKMLLIK